MTDKLTVDGVRLFAEAFDKLLEAVEKSTAPKTAPKVSKQTYKLPDDLNNLVKTNIDDWRAAGKVRRLWQRDASLWTGADEASWLGWLGITEEQLANAETFKRLADEIKREGFTDILLLGMGGSSLCPEVLDKTFGHIAGFPQLARARLYRSGPDQGDRESD